MEVVAHIYPGWRRKWIFMVLFVFAWSGWFAYDASVGYPGKNKKIAAFHHFTNQTGAPHYDANGDPVGWSFKPMDYTGYTDYAAFAQAHGWSTDNPGDFKKDEDIFVQWLFAGGCLVMAIAMAAVVVWHHGRTLKADEKGLTGATGDFVPYEWITDIDRSRWDKKGIAYVHYNHDGETGRIKIDDYVFENGDKVLAQVEQRTGLVAHAMA